MELCLYHMPGACSRVVMNALEEAGATYEDRPVNLFKGQQRSPEMLAENPKGKVPALRVGGQLLTENPSILLYLDEVWPEARLMPPLIDPIDRAQVRSDLIWLSNTVHPLVRTRMMPARVAPGDPASASAAAAEMLLPILGGIAQRLANRTWWYGDDWSIVDVYVHWAVSTAAAAGMSLADFPAIQAHGERVRARPSFQRALAREVRALAAADIDLPPGARL